MKRWQHCLCLLALVCALQTALVVAVMPQTEQDALTTIASTFPILVSGHNWNTTSASTACSAPWYGLTCSGDNVQSMYVTMNPILPRQYPDTQFAHFRHTDATSALPLHSILNGIALNGEIPQDMTPFTALSTLYVTRNFGSFACRLSGSRRSRTL